MIIEESDFKGSKILVFKEQEDSKYPFSFGLKKAKIILDHTEDIKKFVEKYDNNNVSPVSNISQDDLPF